MRDSLRYSKYVKYLIIFFIIVTSSIYWYLKLPVDISTTCAGIKYRLGKNNQNEFRKVTFEIDGKIYKDMFLNKTFVGKIYISDIEDLLDKQYDINTYKKLLNSQVNLQLDKYMRATLFYYMKKASTSYSETIGTIYFEPTFSKFTISVLEKVDNNTRTWSSKDGLIISAPAENRKEALEITNSIIAKVINRNLE